MRRIRWTTLFLLATTPVWVYAGGAVVAGFDVIFANTGRDRVCVSTGAALSCRDISFDSNFNWDVALGDVNEDGFLDAVFSGDISNQVCLGNGDAGFSCNDLSPNLGGSQSVALADLNGDRHLDAVFAAVGRKDYVCLGDGDGTFTCSNMPDPMTIDSVVALGDVNGDTFPDALFGSFASGSGVRACLNNGSGAFPLCDPVGLSAQIPDLALGHLDGDGHLDVVSTRQNATSQLCLGDGSGGFSCTNLTPGAPLGSQAVVVGNFFSGPSLEVVYGGIGMSDTKWCSSSAVGQFDICFAVNSSNMSPIDVGLIDLNGDGLKDLVIANFGLTNEVCINQGLPPGSLFDCAVAGPPEPVSSGATQAVAVVVREVVFADGFETIIVIAR